MGRPRTPTPLLELRGAYKHDPKRKRARQAEPKAGGPLDGAPTSFSAELVSVWDELCELAPPGVLGKADRWLVEVTCQLMLKFRVIGLLRGSGMSSAELNLLVSCLSRMGMTPSDRSRVGIQTPKETAAGDRDRLADLAAHSRAALRIN
jgi:hypothetical protein